MTEDRDESVVHQEGAFRAAVTPEELQPSEQEQALARLQDSSYLPSHEDILTAFGGELQDEFEAFCKHREGEQVYEFINREFIESLGSYLADSVQALAATRDGPATILEVGAGNGRLTHFLRQELERRAPGLSRVVATDVPTDQAGPYIVRRDFEVDEMAFDEALESYSPDIVISSWMPQGKDWTPEFRRRGVSEYYLIGEPDPGVVATPEAWGPPMLDSDDTVDDSGTQYAQDGYTRQILFDVAETQISRNDYTQHGEVRSHSSTYAFRRREDNADNGTLVVESGES